MDGKLLAAAFARNQRIVRMQADGVSNDDALGQHPYNVNCLNWVVGHIVQSRDTALRALDVEPVLSQRERDRYATESDPVTEDGPGVVALDDLLAAMSEQQERLDAALVPLTAARLAAVQAGGDDTTLLGRLHGLYFHETYHVGQTELLRQMSGKSDKII